MNRPHSTTYPVDKSFTAWYLRHFFDILMVLMSVSQWITLWWFVGRPVPWVVHLAGTAGFYTTSMYLAGGFRRSGRLPPRQGRLARIYFATAFTSTVCFCFLVFAGVLAAGLSLLPASVFAEAGGSLGSAGIVWNSFGEVTRLGFAGIGLTFLYGYTIGQRRIRTRRFDIPVPNLPPALDGLSIAQISDIHMGLNLEREQLAGYVDRINDLDADVICITGDMIDSARTDLDAFLPTFARLRARYGVVAILGNHDHAAGAERVVEALRHHTDFTLLRDQHLPLYVGDATLHVLGLDDRGLDWARGLRLDPVLNDLHAEIPSGEPVLLLVHRPDTFEHAAKLGIPLTLSGHTHGGQIGIPWFRGRSLNPSRVLTEFDRGLFRRGASFLYTNPGLGVTSQKLRLATPREITLFRLRRA